MHPSITPQKEKKNIPLKEKIDAGEGIPYRN